MCRKIGVDPLASRKGFWAELLGVGDFYYELGIQIIQVCLETRSTNGGLISLAELLEKIRLIRSRSDQIISSDDVKCAISKIKTLGSGFTILHVGRRTMITSVPIELSSDHSLIMGLAQEDEENGGGGKVTISLLCNRFGWNMDRARVSLNLLIDEGMIWIDKQSYEIEYWFPSLWQKSILNDDDENI